MLRYLRDFCRRGTSVLLIRTKSSDIPRRPLHTADRSQHSSFVTLPTGCGEEFRGDDGESTSFLARRWTECATTVSGGAIFGVAQTDTMLEVAGVACVLRAGMYFSAPETVRLEKGSGLVIVAQNRDVMFTLGGPIEQTGRLRYIDGCSDTLLLPPWRLGQPCLNFLHFPPQTTQTQHTHPSSRVGLVMRGSGTCIYGESGERVALAVGTAFVIPTDLVHAFETVDDILDVVAWHPDSDVGPTDDDHPMINRTMVNGVSASLLEK
mmetsp:Transcript_3697/g.9507  ORF Transcript_3697/g.9507 Transcript_3697/m.9507 type:complete len:265 (+) Transcript_3697:134-928(+)